MQVHYSLDSLPEIPSPVVTVGSFDGVHKGHRTIIQRLNALAEEVGGASVLITFSPHPRKVLYPETAGKDLKMINSLPEKCMLLEEAGLDHLVIMEFTREFALTSSDEFVKYYLLGKLHAHTIVVGFNHFFGHNKEGNYHSLYKNRERLGYRVEEIPEQEIQNETVSSTKIRKALSEGNIQRVNAYLEHLYMVQTRLGKVKNSPSGLSGKLKTISWSPARWILWTMVLCPDRKGNPNASSTTGWVEGMWISEWGMRNAAKDGRQSHRGRKTSR